MLEVQVEPVVADPAELREHVPDVVGGRDLEVLDARGRDAPVEVEAVLAALERRLLGVHDSARLLEAVLEPCDHARVGRDLDGGVRVLLGHGGENDVELAGDLALLQLAGKSHLLEHEGGDLEGGGLGDAVLRVETRVFE